MKRDLKSIEIGTEFGRWTIKEKPHNNGPYTRTMAVCECVCGTVKSVQVGNLVAGKSLSCGCLNREVCAANATHGHSRVGKRNRLYNIWAMMIQRCTNSRMKDFRYYGGRGITVYKDWKKYIPFMEWAQSSGYRDGLTIERKNVNGNYCPSNCTWIPQNRQSKNQRRIRMITAFGETKCISDWVDDHRCVISQYSLIDRIVRGWPYEQAISTPKQHRWSRRGANVRMNKPETNA